MESVILEFGLCVIESVIMFLFFNSLFKKRFHTAFPILLCILINSVIEFLCSDLNMGAKSFVAVCALFVGCSVLYKEKTTIKVAYSFLSLYILYIVDIIFGNIFSLLVNRSIMELLFTTLIYRMIFSLIIKAIDALTFILIYKMVSEIEPSKNKYRFLFCVITFAFWAVAAVFLQNYPSAELSEAETVMYTLISSLFFAMSLIVIYFFTEISKGFQRDSKLFLLENNFNSLQEQIVVQQQNSDKIQKLRHDMKNHLSNVRSLIESGEISDAVMLLDKAAENVNLSQAEKVINTGNSFADAILLSKAALCSDKSIDFTYSVQPLENISIDVVDLSSLLSNLLDNAIESAAQTSAPYVKIVIVKYNVYYTICVENSYKGKEFLKEGEGVLLSTKSDKALHGYGTQIISDISRKYDGSFSWEAQENKFIATVLIKI